MTQFNFDARQIAPDTGFETVPKGWYNVMIDETEIKPTRNGGTLLKARCVILDGQFKGRKLFTQINLQHTNPIVVEIGQKQLSAICHATGVLQFQQTTQLHNIPVKVRVKIRVDKDGEYDDQNEITSWKHISENVGGEVAPPAQFAPPGAPQGQQFQAPPQNFAPAAPAANWAPPPQQQAPAAPQMPPPNSWAPPPQQQAPAPQYQQPVAAPQAPAPTWQPPQGAVQQPWQGQQGAPQAPAAPPAPMAPMAPPQAPGAPQFQPTGVPPWGGAK